MVQDTPSCQAYGPNKSGPFFYQPSLAAGIVFTTLFFLSSCLFVVGAGAECLGWIARTAASECSYSTSLFTMQISLLIFALAWATAGVYIALFKMAPILGKNSCPFPPKACLSICLGVDIISLILQATGGGLAGQSFSSDVNTRPGTLTMVAGILFQLASIVTYSILMFIVFSRGKKEITASKPLRWLTTTLVFVIICMITKGVYRTIELLQGWFGYLNTHQAYVIGLNGSLIVLAVLVLNLCDPGRLLQLARKEMEAEMGQKMISLEEDEAKGCQSEDSDVV